MKIEEYNQSSLNRRCRELLEKEHLSPDPDCLYSLQILDWALENLELAGPWAQDRDGLEDYMVQLHLADTEEAHRILQKQAQEMDLADYPDLLALAARLLEDQYIRLKERRNQEQA